MARATHFEKFARQTKCVATCSIFPGSGTLTSSGARGPFSVVATEELVSNFTEVCGRPRPSRQGGGKNTILTRRPVEVEKTHWGPNEKTLSAPGGRTTPFQWWENPDCGLKKTFVHRGPDKRLGVDNSRVSGNTRTCVEITASPEGPCFCEAPEIKRIGVSKIWDILHSPDPGMSESPHCRSTNSRAMGHGHRRWAMCHKSCPIHGPLAKGPQTPDTRPLTPGTFAHATGHSAPDTTAHKATGHQPMGMTLVEFDFAHVFAASKLLRCIVYAIVLVHCMCVNLFHPTTLHC